MTRTRMDGNADMATAMTERFNVGGAMLLKLFGHRETEDVRFAEKAANVYRGVTPLHPEDVAEVIAFAATRPPHVNLDQIVVKARDQATATRTHRREG